MSALEEAAIARDDVRPGVTGNLDEAVRGEYNRIVCDGGVGQDEAVSQPGIPAAVAGEGFGGAHGELVADEARIDVGRDDAFNLLLWAAEDGLELREGQYQR